MKFLTITYKTTHEPQGRSQFDLQFRQVVIEIIHGLCDELFVLTSQKMHGIRSCMCASKEID